jgi:hypothetical protein
MSGGPSLTAGRWRQSQDGVAVSEGDTAPDATPSRRTSKNLLSLMHFEQSHNCLTLNAGKTRFAVGLRRRLRSLQLVIEVFR